MGVLKVSYDQLGVDLRGLDGVVAKQFLDVSHRASFWTMWVVQLWRRACGDTGLFSPAFKTGRF